MKFFILSLAAAMIIMNFNTADSQKMSLEEIKNFIKPYLDTCFKKIPISEDIVSGIKEGKFPGPDQDVKCFALCFFKHAKIIKDGKVTLEDVIHHLEVMAPEDLVARVKNVYSECSNRLSGKQYDDECDLAYDFAKCAFEIDHGMFTFF